MTYGVAQQQHRGKTSTIQAKRSRDERQERGGGRADPKQSNGSQGEEQTRRGAEIGAAGVQRGRCLAGWRRRVGPSPTAAFVPPPRSVPEELADVQSVLIRSLRHPRPSFIHPPPSDQPTVSWCPLRPSSKVLSPDFLLILFL
jgi:hypothetical protein